MKSRGITKAEIRAKLAWAAQTMVYMYAPGLSSLSEGCINQERRMPPRVRLSA
jgi:hypothetical protein